VTLAAILAAAVAIGLLLGLLGGGGSILTLPVLVYLAGQQPQSAITASLFVVAVTSAVALVPHARAGRVRWRTGLVFGTAGVAGATAVGVSGDGTVGATGATGATGGRRGGGLRCERWRPLESTTVSVYFQLKGGSSLMIPVQISSSSEYAPKRHQVRPTSHVA